MKNIILALSIVLISTSVLAEKRKYEGRFVLQPPYTDSYKMSVITNTLDTPNVIYQGGKVSVNPAAYKDGEMLSTEKSYCTHRWVVNLGDATIEILQGQNKYISREKITASIFKVHEEQDTVERCNEPLESAPANLNYLMNFNHNETLKFAIPGNDIQTAPGLLNTAFVLSTLSDEVKLNLDEQTGQWSVSNLPALPDEAGVVWSLTVPTKNSLYMPNGNLQYEEKEHGQGKLPLVR